MIFAKFLETNVQCFLEILQCLVILPLGSSHLPDGVIANGHIKIVFAQVVQPKI